MSKRHSFKRVALVGLLSGAAAVALGWMLWPQFGSLEALALFALACVAGPLLLDPNPATLQSWIAADNELDYPDHATTLPPPESPEIPNSNNLHT